LFISEITMTVKKGRDEVSRIDYILLTTLTPHHQM
jgi:hypothetical protein